MVAILVRWTALHKKELFKKNSTALYKNKFNELGQAIAIIPVEKPDKYALVGFPNSILEFKD